MLLHQFLMATAARLPAKTALVCGPRRLTYQELAEASAALAARLQALGVQRGDRVAVFMDNTPEMVIAIQAVLQAGGVFLPVNPLTKGDKLGYVLNDAEAVALLGQATLAAECDRALALSPATRISLMAGEPPAGSRHLPLAEAAAGTQTDAQPGPAAVSPPAAARPAPVPVIDQDLAAIIYTSGTTGHPKGVMLSHLNLRSAVDSVIEYLGLAESDVIASALPLSFGYGLNQMLTAFKVGATLLLERSFAFPVKVVETMERERATVFPGVPTMYALLTGIKTLGQHDLSSLRILTNAAAALSAEHIARLRALLPQARLFSMYGQTECTRVSFLPPEEIDRRPLSVGRGMPNQELWLADEAGHRLPPGHTGELVVRGSHVMRGYWKRPEDTAQRLRPAGCAHVPPGERVLFTGDLFRMDEEGWLYFVARQDDVIKSRGEKVSPREVEEAIYALPQVLEAAVIGVPDPLLGQAIKAFVVLREGEALSERELIRHCLGRLESYMAPKLVEFRDELPKTANGKIRKTELA